MQKYRFKKKKIFKCINGSNLKLNTEQSTGKMDTGKTRDMEKYRTMKYISVWELKPHLQ